MRKIILILVLFLLSIAVVFGQESHDSEIEDGMKLMESKISCDKLNNEQLEAIGEYYMEQMHSGEAHEIMDNMMGGGSMMGYDYGNYWYWSIFWILFFIAVICFIVWIIYRFGIKNPASETPLNILKKRFAQGEITKKEFETMKKKLRA
ncbi:SHOCT domain-containing protein [Candidatus Woesearchaeota archaeon]|nr:SHOCT domain-containing protein [Candidatus Woesearchaeota archaeon]